MADPIPDPAAVVAAALRRNGKKSSCEPCRKSKLSCDHIRPICGRCQRRRAPDRCVYHPAPMTNAQRPGSTSSRENRSWRQDKNSHNESVASDLGHGPIGSSFLVEDRLTDASPPDSGFLGPTSYSAVFTEGQSHMSIVDKELSREIKNHRGQTYELPSWDSSKVKEGAEVLSLLADLPKYDPILNKWFKVQYLATMTLYVRECISLIPSTIEDGHGQSQCLTTLSHKVFLRTSTPYSLNTKITLREYPPSLMGENLCWEIVGIMLTAVGLSAISMHKVNIDDECDSQTDWKDLAQQLLRAGDQCIAFCEQFGHLKDIGVTLILINFILQTQVYGDASQFAGAES